MIIAVPTGVKIFNWLFTMYGGRVRFTVPVLWSIGFMVTFVFGGMTGVLLALPPADLQVHNSLFLVAHFHHVIIGGVVFGVMAGYQLLVSEGVRLQARRTLGRPSFWCWFIGFYLAFMPLYVVGLMGMTRRLQHYDVLELAAMATGRGGGRGDHSGWDRLPGRPARGVDSRPRAAARHDRRSMERPDAGMVDRLAASGLEFCGPAAGRRKRRLLDKETTLRRRSKNSRCGCAKYQPIEMPKNNRPVSSPRSLRS